MMLKGERFKKGGILALATVGFVGWAPYHLVPFRKLKGGGLLGTLVGWALAWTIPDGPVFWVGTLAMVAFAVVVSGAAERYLTHDDPRIVIDEVAGIWVATCGLAREPVAMVTALVAFRFFDVWKGPWGRALSRWPGGWGIVADDVGAALIAHVFTRLLMQW